MRRKQGQSIKLFCRTLNCMHFIEKSFYHIRLLQIEQSSVVYQMVLSHCEFELCDFALWQSTLTCAFRMHLLNTKDEASSPVYRQNRNVCLNTAEWRRLITSLHFIFLVCTFIFICFGPPFILEMPFKQIQNRMWKCLLSETMMFP